jgi:magnesium chelatase family protein
MHEILRYQKKISGPLLDRIDIQINVPRVDIKELQKNKNKPEKENPQHQKFQEQISLARARQLKRLQKSGPAKKIFTNSEMSSKEVDSLLNISPEAENFIKEIFDKSLISVRGYYRILKTAQTIADLNSRDRIEKPDLAEAFSYRLREN